MELVRRLLPSQDGKGLLSTRGGTIGVAVGAAVVAGIVLLVFLQKYRDDVHTSALPVKVLVAGGAIQKGTSGDVIAGRQLFQPTDLRGSQVKQGAITDPAVLRGKVAIDDIYPGQQLTLADFKASSGLTTKLAPDERAIAIPLDQAHGMIGEVKTGDRVDVLSGFMVDSLVGRPRPFLKVLVPNALVLKAADGPKSGGITGGGSSNSNDAKQVVLRVSQDDAPKVAFASDNGKVWLLLRGAGAAAPNRRTLISLESTLFGVRPITSLRQLRSRR